MADQPDPGRTYAQAYERALTMLAARGYAVLLPDPALSTAIPVPSPPKKFKNPNVT